MRSNYTFMECHILGSCSGLLLLFIDDDLCVANPLTKKFRFLNPSTFMVYARMLNSRQVVRLDITKHIGFAVDRTTKCFKIVHMAESATSGKKVYSFEINAGNSWRHSKTTVTCHSSDLDSRMKNPVYFDGSLHWLRNDGSIIALNPETEQARLIPIKFPQGLSLKTLFAARDISLTLISATEEAIYVYALENIHSDPKWFLVTQIGYRLLDANRLVYWNVEAYDGKCLVLSENRTKKSNNEVHVYDFRANKWVVMGSVPRWSDVNQDIFQFTPSFSSVVGLDQMLACDDKRISSLSSIIGLIDGTSSEIAEKQLRKISVEAKRR